MRESYGLNHGWRFARRRVSWRELRRPDPRWQVVDLPHTWNDRDGFQRGTVYHRGWAGYSRTFTCPEPAADAEPGRWLLVAGGFYGLAELRLDGHRLASVDGQYLGFSLDISDRLHPGSSHRLAIRLTNRCPSWVLPGVANYHQVSARFRAALQPDFVLFGGLAGGLFLERVPAVRIADEATRISSEQALAAEATVTIESPLLNHTDRAQTLRLRWTLVDPSGREVAATESGRIELPPRGAAAAKKQLCKLAVSRPELWSPERPALYTVRGRLSQGERTLDQCELRCGIRQAEFTPEGFFLNGSRLELRGLNRHESVPGLGNALPRWLHREDAETIKELGGNFVRLSHYPQHPSFLEACDQLGILVCPEIASWRSVRGGRWLRSAERQMRGMLLRDRNHPSIILWGMGNESRRRDVYLALDRLIRELSPDRPSIYAENSLVRARRKGTTDLPDVWGINYELSSLEDVADCSKLGAVLVCECCNLEAQRGALREEARQIDELVDCWSVLEGHPRLAGHALWCLSDYGTMFRKRFTRHNGKLDAWRQPKLAAALIKARQLDRPFVQLFGNWSHKAKHRARELFLFSNCERVELRLGERVLANIEGSLHSRLRADFEPQDVIAVGYRRGESIESRLRFHGRGTRLQIEPERRSISATEREWVGLRVQVVDADGVVASDWEGRVELAVDGPARLGLPTTAESIVVAAGRGRCFLRATGEAGAVKVSASAEAVESAEAVIEAELRAGGSPVEI